MVAVVDFVVVVIVINTKRPVAIFLSFAFAGVQC